VFKRNMAIIILTLSNNDMMPKVWIVSFFVKRKTSVLTFCTSQFPCRWKPLSELFNRGNILNFPICNF
jgi:hypothetical protein